MAPRSLWEVEEVSRQFLFRHPKVHLDQILNELEFKFVADLFLELAKCCFPTICIQPCLFSMSSASEDELSIRSDDDDGAHSEAEEAPASRRRKRSQNEGESEDAEADAAVEAVADVETKGVKAVRKVTAPRPKFTVDVLLGATGLSRVVKQFPKIKFKPGSDVFKRVGIDVDVERCL